MSFKEIWDALYTKIVELKTAGKLSEVYNYEPKVDEGFTTPCVIITPTDGSETILDTAYNAVLMPFHVRVIDQATDDRAAMENNIRSLADEVMEKIKDLSEITRSNGATKRKTYTYTWGRTNTPTPMRVCEILVEFLACEEK